MLDGIESLMELFQCLTHGISATSFMSAALFDSDGAIVDDSFDIGNPQTVTVADGKSWARKYDGSTSIIAASPTPGATSITTTTSINAEITNTLASVSNGILYLPEGTSGVQLFNISGNLILSQSAITDASLDLNYIPKRLYVVKLTISGKTVIQKLAL